MSFKIFESNSASNFSLSIIQIHRVGQICGPICGKLEHSKADDSYGSVPLDMVGQLGKLRGINLTKTSPYGVPRTRMNGSQGTNQCRLQS